MDLRRWFGSALVVGLLSVLLLVPSAPASADVLHVVPKSSVCRGTKVTVGVWYQEYSGGSRKYVVKVKAPSGKVVLHKKGKATDARWKTWNVKAKRAGKYRVVYRTNGIRTTYKVRSSAC